MEAYVQLKVLGKGSFGSAWLIQRRRDGQQFVAKEVRLQGMKPADRDAAKHEITMLRQLDHPNITRYVDHFEHRGSLYIVMEYANGGDLYTKIKGRRGVRFSEKEILQFFSQLCLALMHMHEKHILHRDLKSQNVFLTQDGVVKLGDFGISTVLRNTYELRRTVCGTPYYFSPELCQSKPYNNKSDVWALGCILYELTTLTHAFEGNSMKALIQKILRGVYPPIHSSYSQDLSQLISAMLSIDPKQRPNVHNIVSCNYVRNGLSQLRQGVQQQQQGQPRSLVDAGEKVRAQQEAVKRLEEEKKKHEAEAKQRELDAKQRQEDKERQYAEKAAAMRKKLELEAKEHEEKLKRIREQGERQREVQREQDVKRKQEYDDRMKRQEVERKQRMQMAAQYAAQNRQKEQDWDVNMKRMAEEARMRQEMQQQQQEGGGGGVGMMPGGRQQQQQQTPTDEASRVYWENRRAFEANKRRAYEDQQPQAQHMMQQQQQNYNAPQQQQPQRPPGCQMSPFEADDRARPQQANRQQNAEPALSKEQKEQLHRQALAEAAREARREAEANKARLRELQMGDHLGGGGGAPSSPAPLPRPNHNNGARQVSPPTDNYSNAMPQQPQQYQQQQPPPRPTSQNAFNDITDAARSDAYWETRKAAEANRRRLIDEAARANNQPPPQEQAPQLAHPQQQPQQQAIQPPGLAHYMQQIREQQQQPPQPQPPRYEPYRPRETPPEPEPEAMAPQPSSDGCDIIVSDSEDEDGDQGLHRFLNSEAAAATEEQDNAHLLGTKERDYNLIGDQVGAILNQGMMCGEDFGDEEGPDDAMKFMLEGQTLRLPNSNHTDPLSMRIEALRMFLEQTMGDEWLLFVYRHLTTIPGIGEQAVGPSEVDEMDEIRAQLPKHLYRYLPVVTQLVACEQFCYNNANLA